MNYLDIQVTETEYEAIFKEAKAIVGAFGKNPFVKIPATTTGIAGFAADWEKAFDYRTLGSMMQNFSFFDV